MSTTNQTPLEQIKAALAELKEAREKTKPGPWRTVGLGYNIEGFPQVEFNTDRGHYIKVHNDEDAEFIALSANQWLNLLRVIELQSECLSKISAEFGTDYCDGNCVDARINLEQSAAILSGGSK